MAPIDKLCKLTYCNIASVRYHCKIVEIKFEEEFFVSENSHIFLQDVAAVNLSSPPKLTSNHISVKVMVVCFYMICRTRQRHLVAEYNTV